MEFSGIINNLNMTQKAYGTEGKTFTVYSFTLSTGKEFKSISFKNRFRPQNGQNVRIVEMDKPGSKYKDYEGFELPAGAVAAAPVQQTYTAPTYSGKSDTQQASIIRQFAVREAIAVLNMMIGKDLLPKKVVDGFKKSDELVFALIGNYAQIIHNAVKDEAGFQALEGFKGQVNEVGDLNDALPSDMAA